MRKPIFFAPCPCCGEKLVGDMRLRRIDAAEGEKAKRSSLLDDAGSVLDKDEEQRQDRFDQAFDEETEGKKPTLDDFL